MYKDFVVYCEVSLVNRQLTRYLQPIGGELFFSYNQGVFTKSNFLKFLQFNFSFKQINYFFQTNQLNSLAGTKNSLGKGVLYEFMY